jgi:ribonucleotide reductase alpha subunit
MKFHKYIENKLVGKIQIQYRHRMTLAPDKKISDMVRVRNIFRLRSSVLRAHFYDMAKEVVGEFIDSLIMPYKTKYMCLQFILGIKNMQRRWLKHLEKKREVLEHFELMWEKFLIRLADREEDYKKMGITYNLENVKFISMEVRGKIAAHLFDRQILRYIDAKYERLE